MKKETVKQLRHLQQKTVNQQTRMKAKPHKNWYLIIAIVLLVGLGLMTVIPFKSNSQQQPKATSKRLIVKKRYGIGVTINLRNPIGFLIYVRLVVLVIFSIVQMMMQR
ncbi:DUF5808 domain-containing protein [Agrilactobacillus fermenti]|uniref:DUF5808 domain-containing protein n=1 Tax=Agrilactobacillus fermenti TaxID=2586909 RepID=UPI003A5C38DF